MNKICTNCKQKKDLDDFYKRKLSSDGHCSECKLCSKHRNKNNNHRYYLANKQKVLTKNKKYLKTYKDKYKNRRNALNKLRFKNPEFKLAHYLRRRMNLALKRNQKCGSAVSDLGCSIQEFKTYIETKFQPKMNWYNYGKWHLDHIKPLISFDLSNRQEFLKAAHYTNYQPLWAHDNLVKSNKY